MTALALAVLLAQSPAAVGERSMVSKCAVSDDATYHHDRDGDLHAGALNAARGEGVE